MSYKLETEREGCPSLSPDLESEFLLAAKSVLDKFEAEDGPLRERDLSWEDRENLQDLVKSDFYNQLGLRSERTTSPLREGWSIDPCTPGGVEMQEAASCLFRKKKEHGCEDFVGPRAEELFSKKVVEAVLAESVIAQEAIRRWCQCEEVELHRGLVGFEPESCTRIPVRPLSSWTTDKKEAAFFALQFARDKTPQFHLVVSKRIPVKRIVAWSPVSEFLSVGEQEAVVISEDGHETICPENIHPILEEKK